MAFLMDGVIQYYNGSFFSYLHHQPRFRHSCLPQQHPSCKILKRYSSHGNFEAEKFLKQTSFSSLGGSSSPSSSCSSSVSSDSSEELCGSSGVGSSVFFLSPTSSKPNFYSKNTIEYDIKPVLEDPPQQRHMIIRVIGMTTDKI